MLLKTMEKMMAMFRQGDVEATLGTITKKQTSRKVLRVLLRRQIRHRFRQSMGHLANRRPGDGLVLSRPASHPQLFSSQKLTGTLFASVLRARVAGRSHTNKRLVASSHGSERTPQRGSDFHRTLLATTCGWSANGNVTFSTRNRIRPCARCNGRARRIACYSALRANPPRRPLATRSSPGSSRAIILCLAFFTIHPPGRWQ